LSHLLHAQNNPFPSILSSSFHFTSLRSQPIFTSRTSGR
jgi:hypothetical protein